MNIDFAELLRYTFLEKQIKGDGEMKYTTVYVKQLEHRKGKPW